jgi:6,7-dimethyl-8-ribityllumazine synthase
MSTSPLTISNINNLPINDAQVVVVYTSWNHDIVNELLNGVKRIFDQYPNNIKYTLIEVPGCIEITSVIKHHWKKKSADAYIALGCVIKGETAHFEYVCQSITYGITQLNIELSAPTIFGVLTVNTHQQAIDRIGGKHGHKGEEAAITAIRMIDVLRTI